jgi:lysophospholipase
LADIATYEEAPLVTPYERPLPISVSDDGLRDMRAFFLRHEVQGKPLRMRVFMTWPKLAKGKTPRGSIIIHPGRTEFIEKYFETIADLTRRGFVVITIDPRGQGLSDRLVNDPLKSFVHRYRHYGEDIGFVQRKLEDQLPRPHILLGHSMGGLAVIDAVIEKAADPDILIASAPMLGIWEVTTPVLKYGFRTLDRLGLGTRDLPFQKQERGIPVEFENNKLTSDPERFRLWRDYFLSTPELRVAGPTIRWLAESVRTMDRVNRRAHQIDIPTLLFAPGADPIVDPASIRKFGARAGADVVTVVGARHELFLEQDQYRDQFFEGLDEFLDAHEI